MSMFVGNQDCKRATSRAVQQAVHLAAFVVGWAPVLNMWADAAEYDKLPLESPPSLLVASEDGRSFVVAHSEHDLLSVGDVETGKILRTIKCSRPQAVLFRDGKMFVASNAKGTITVFSPAKDWAAVDELPAGDNNIFYLSAPQGVYFRGEILASSRVGNHLSLTLIHINQRTANKVVQGSGDVATVDYEGRYVINQAERIQHIWEFARPEVTTTIGQSEELREIRDRAGINLDAVVYQVRPGRYWFGLKSVRKGMPPGVLGVERGQMVLPDLQQNVFYVFQPNSIQCVGLDPAMTEIGTKPISFPPISMTDRPEMRSRFSGQNSVRNVLYNNFAVTLGTNLHVYILDTARSCLYHGRLEAFKVPVAVLAAGGDHAEGLELPAEFPGRVAVGQPISHPIFSHSPGKYEIVVAPQGLKISKSGLLTWTPTEADVGYQRLRIWCRLESRALVVRYDTDVVQSKDLAKPAKQ